MALLIGSYEYSLDPKSRLSVPPKYKEALLQEKGTCFYITNGMDGCLYLFLPSQWNKLLENDLREFTTADKEEERAFKRGFFSAAHDVEPDAAGRILIPPQLKERAGLKGRVLVQGAGKRAEIWDYKKWDIYNKSKVEPAYRKASKTIEL